MFLTPKALHLKAQGRERSERTLGPFHRKIPYAEGVTSQSPVSRSAPSDPLLTLR
jgi:hypothetical protein